MSWINIDDSIFVPSVRFDPVQNILFFGANGVATVVSTWFKRTFPEANARVSLQQSYTCGAHSHLCFELLICSCLLFCPSHFHLHFADSNYRLGLDAARFLFGGNSTLLLPLHPLRFLHATGCFQV